MTQTQWKSSREAIEAVIAALPADAKFHYPIRHGSMRVGLYQPQRQDDQRPHSQDELYIIASGTGCFVRDGIRTLFKPQDLFFVPAGVAHHFEDFGADFATWVIFWGPEGGEI